MYKLPQFFNNLTITSLETIEKLAIERGDLNVRFLLRKAVLERNETAQRAIIQVINKDPSWIAK